MADNLLELDNVFPALEIADADEFALNNAAGQAQQKNSLYARSNKLPRGQVNLVKVGQQRLIATTQHE